MDWITWPIFSVYLLALILMLFKGRRRILGVKIHTIIVGLIMLAALGIAVSLFHDSSDVLKLYF